MHLQYKKSFVKLGKVISDQCSVISDQGAFDYLLTLAASAIELVIND